MSRLYAMYDPDPRGVFPVRDMGEATKLNAERHGIFATVNRFRGPRRLENLERIESWSVDIDSGSKDEQVHRINRSPLVPSSVVETKSGFHVHFRAKLADESTWAAIVEHRLVPFFQADRNAKDIARILRVPSMWHWKDPAEPFYVRKVHAWDVSYRPDQMLAAFPAPEAITAAQERSKADAPRVRSEAHFSGDTSGDSFWQRAIELDCRYALERLSGHWLVGGEQYSFRRVRSGNVNILVDRKTTSCWIDAAGKIGSKTGGGPSIVRWCRWLGHSYRDIARGLREVFPELEGQ